MLIPGPQIISEGERGRICLNFCHKNQILKVETQELSSALEMLVAKLLAGEGQLPDVLQTVGGRLLHVLVLGADEPEEMSDHS